jgi:hypothetical protein
MIMLTTYEKREFVSKLPTITNPLFENKTTSMLFFKVLVNYFDKTNINQLQFSHLNETVLENTEQMKSIMAEILKNMATIAAEESEFSPTYTTGQLATYFGVSITTINNWVKEGRFQGVERVASNKQVRISENTLWKSRSGKLIPVSLIVKDHELEQAEQGENLSDSDEVSFLINQMALYEDKYGGNFEVTLGSKRELTPEEQTDLSVWKYFMKRYNELRVDKNSKN